MKANTVLAENAYNYILDEILKGRIQPGETPADIKTRLQKQ